MDPDTPEADYPHIPPDAVERARAYALAHPIGPKQHKHDHTLRADPDVVVRILRDMPGDRAWPDQQRLFEALGYLVSAKPVDPGVMREEGFPDAVWAGYSVLHKSRWVSPVGRAPWLMRTFETYRVVWLAFWIGAMGENPSPGRRIEATRAIAPIADTLREPWRSYFLGLLTFPPRPDS